LPVNAPEGLCPRCLLALNLSTDADPPDSLATKAPPPPPLPVSEVASLFPQLEILEALGRGGMGAIYKVRQPRLDRLAALKILSPEKQGDQQFAGRFEREARTLAQMNHPNIVTIYDFGETHQHCYLLMEFVDGLTLRQLLQSRKLPPAEALAIVPKICEALQYAHQRGVVHRDIKPENILLDKHGRVKIADFGIAKMTGTLASTGLTEERQVIGTPHYMAPEQVEKPLAVDHRADIFSLGVVFYEMLTGELPLGKFAPPSSRMSGIEVDVRLDEVVLRALEKEPDRRYQQASEVKSDVETIVAAKSNPITPAPQPSPQNKNPKNMNTNTKKSFWPVIVVLCLVVAGLAAWFLLRTGNDPARANKLTQEGWQLWQGREMDQARAKFNQAVRMEPTNTAAWNGLGWASFNLGQSQEAEKAFQKVLALEPDHPGALNGLGQIYLSQKNYDMAEIYLLKAAPVATAACYGLARLYLIQEKFDEAAKWAGKVVDSGQGDETAQKMLQAAKDKHISDGLRIALGLPPAQ
jgi:tRNA A-37 threonylcarbamoyl transferase component Bud32/cytochrome c-type biogenesis protein CcmH/NrfG